MKRDGFFSKWGPWVCVYLLAFSLIGATISSWYAQDLVMAFFISGGLSVLFLILVIPFLEIWTSPKFSLIDKIMWSALVYAIPFTIGVIFYYIVGRKNALD